MSSAISSHSPTAPMIAGPRFTPRAGRGAGAFVAGGAISNRVVLVVAMHSGALHSMQKCASAGLCPPQRGQIVIRSSIPQRGNGQRAHSYSQIDSGSDELLVGAEPATSRVVLARCVVVAVLVSERRCARRPERSISWITSAATALTGAWDS